METAFKLFVGYSLYVAVAIIVFGVLYAVVLHKDADPSSTDVDCYGGDDDREGGD